MENPYVSVILPVFNEEECIVLEIERVHRALKKSGMTYELIVVDDASKDRSLQRAREFAANNKDCPIRILQLKSNLGSGNARRVGSKAALGEIVVWTDVDMTYPNERIPDLIEEMNRLSVDQIVGARDREMGTVRVLRTPAKWMLRRTAEYLTGCKIPDLNSGLRAFRREVGAKYLHRLPNGFSCVTTLTLSFLSDGHTVAYTPIEYSKRVGKSKFHPVKDTAKYLRQIVMMVMSYRPLKVFGTVFILLFLAGLAVTAYSVHEYSYIPSSAVILFLTSLHVLSIGLLADLIVQRTRNLSA